MTDDYHNQIPTPGELRTVARVMAQRGMGREPKPGAQPNPPPDHPYPESASQASLAKRGTEPSEAAREALELLNATQEALSYFVANHRNPSAEDTISTLLGLHDCSKALRIRQALAGSAPSESHSELEVDPALTNEQYCEAANYGHRASTQAEAPQATFQQRVQPWMMACFGEQIAGDRKERNHRFLEESLELVQACGCTASEAHQLVDYVYGRPVGEKSQEVGGVMVTLAALCLAQNLDMQQAGETELARIWTKVDKIREKQAAKPKHSPLPEAPQVCKSCGKTHELGISTESGVCFGCVYDPPHYHGIFNQEPPPRGRAAWAAAGLSQDPADA